MKIGCDWKRDSDKTKRYSMEFHSIYEFANFFETFLKKDNVGEILNFRIFKINL